MVMLIKDILPLDLSQIAGSNPLRAVSHLPAPWQLKATPGAGTCIYKYRNGSRNH
jgi:hypothetical protein